MHDGYTREDDIVVRNSVVASKKEEVVKGISRFFSTILKPKKEHMETENEEEINPI
jgi:hypothetical protein